MTFESKRSRTPNRCKELSETDLEQVRGGKVLDNPAYEAGVDLNPLYVGSDAGGDNPLYV